MPKNEPPRTSLTPLAADVNPEDEDRDPIATLFRDDSIRESQGLQSSHHQQVHGYPFSSSPGLFHSDPGQRTAHPMVSSGSSMAATTSLSRFPEPGSTSSQPTDRIYNQAFSDLTSRFPLPMHQEAGSAQLQSTDRQYNQGSADVANRTPLSMVASHYPFAAQHPAFPDPSSLASYPPSISNSAPFLSAAQANTPAMPFGSTGAGMFPHQGIPLNDARLSQARGSDFSVDSGSPWDTQRGSTASSATPSQYWSSSSTDNPSASSSQLSARTGSGARSWGSRPHTADETFQYTDSSSSTASLTGELLGDPIHERAWSSSSFDSVSPGLASTGYFGAAGGSEGRENLGEGSSSGSGSRQAFHGGGDPSGSSGTNWSTPPLEAGSTGERKKRPRRKFHEIDRMYACGYKGCDKQYGTLTHLNFHVALQGHGPKRNAEDFREIRREWRAKKREEARLRQTEAAAQQAQPQHGETSQHPHQRPDATARPLRMENDPRRPQSRESPRSSRLPQASMARPRGNTGSSSSNSNSSNPNAAKLPLLVRPGRSASGPTPVSRLGSEMMTHSFSNNGVGGMMPSSSSSSSSSATGSPWSPQSGLPSRMAPPPSVHQHHHHFASGIPLNLPGPDPSVLPYGPILSQSAGGISPQVRSSAGSSSVPPNHLSAQRVDTFGGGASGAPTAQFSVSPSGSTLQSPQGEEGRFAFPHLPQPPPPPPDRRQ